MADPRKIIEGTDHELKRGDMVVIKGIPGYAFVVSGFRFGLDNEAQCLLRLRRVEDQKWEPACGQNHINPNTLVDGTLACRTEEGLDSFFIYFLSEQRGKVNDNAVFDARNQRRLGEIAGYCKNITKPCKAVAIPIRDIELYNGKKYKEEMARNEREDADSHPFQLFPGQLTLFEHLLQLCSVAFFVTAFMFLWGCLRYMYFETPPSMEYGRTLLWIMLATFVPASAVLRNGGAFDHKRSGIFYPGFGFELILNPYLVLWAPVIVAAVDWTIVSWEDSWFWFLCKWIAPVGFLMVAAFLAFGLLGSVSNMFSPKVSLWATIRYGFDPRYLKLCFMFGQTRQELAIDEYYDKILEQRKRKACRRDGTCANPG